MAIKNVDGSTYQPTGSLQQFNQANTELDLFDLWDQEAIVIGGSPLYYYDLFINSNDIDTVHMEARSKIFSPCPICIYGFYDPIPSSNMLGTFGIDAPDEMMFEFNLRYVKKTIGHLPKIGARIHSPHRNEDWQIVQRNVEMFKLWGEIRLQVMCIRFQESLTTGEGKVTQRRPDYQFNKIKDLDNRINLAGGQSA